MKARNPFFGMLVLTLVGFMGASFASGQGFGVSGGTRSTDGTGGGAGIEFGPPKSGERPEPKKITIQLTVVGKDREWTNTEGAKIFAALVAFPKPPGEKNAPIEILKNGRVRFLRDNDYKTLAEYPVEKLSEEDREFISNLALNIRLSADAEREQAEIAAEKAEEEKERAEEEKAKTEAKAKEIFK